MKILITLLFSFFLALSVQAQTQIELVQANELAGTKGPAGSVQRLLGDVILRHENATMWCDSAWLNQDSNSMEAFGRVMIKQGDSITLTGKYLNYKGNTKKAFIRDDVFLTDIEMNLTTRQLEYSLAEKTGYYTTGGTITNSENILTSQIGTYNASSKVFSFKKNVLLVNPEYTLKCDTLLYNTVTKVAYFFGPTTISGAEAFIYCENGWYNTINRKARFSRNAYVINKEYRVSADSLIYGGEAGIDTALRNILFLDTANKMEVRGHRGVYNRNISLAVVTDQAIAAMEVDGDSLFIHADTLKTLKEPLDSNRVLQAYRKVKIFKSDLQGVCDSLHYSQKDSLISLLTRPVVWNAKNQLTADTIRIEMSGGKISKINMLQNSLIIERKDSNMYNQIRGIITEGYFQDSKLHKIDVTGNGESIYYLEEDSTTLIGVNKIACSKMTILIDSGQIGEIRFYEKPEGTLFPLDKISLDEMKLKGFTWLAHLRPARKEDLLPLKKP